jgi:hypothetical protein
MPITRLTGGNTPAAGGDPRTFPAIWNGTADGLEAGEYSKVPTGGVAGEVLVKQSATDYDAAWVVRAEPFINISTKFYGPTSNTTSNNRPLDTLCYIPIWFPNPTTLSSISIDTTATAAAGGVARLGLYSSDTGGLPSTLIQDAGTVATDAGTGRKTVSITPVVVSGLVYAAVVLQVAAPTIRCISTVGMPPQAGFAAASALNVPNVPAQLSVSGTLPSTASSLITQDLVPLAVLGVA